MPYIPVPFYRSRRLWAITGALLFSVGLLADYSLQPEQPLFSEVEDYLGDRNGWYGLCSKGGGVTPALFEASVQADPFLHHLYRNVHIASVYKSTGGKAFVTYKEHGEVSWTNRPLQLVPGEPILVAADGTEYRGNCCNKLRQLHPPTPPVQGALPLAESSSVVLLLLGLFLLTLVRGRIWPRRNR